MLGHTLFMRGADEELQRLLVHQGFRVLEVHVGSRGPRAQSGRVVRGG
jgi:hypothetical protein